MSLSARTCRLAAWSCWAGAVVSGLLLVASVLMPFSWAGGKWGVVLAKGELAVGHASHDLRTEWDEGSERPLWIFAGSGGRAQVWAPVAWRPSQSNLDMTVMPPGKNARMVTSTFGVQWLPLFWPITVFATAGLFFTFWARRGRAAGLCRQCGYDLRGIAARVCPECGGAAVTA